MKEQLAEHWESAGTIKDKRLIKAFKDVPREKFIRQVHMKDAYGDFPLPIGHGQTISQPTTVMIMTEALELNPGDKVLEVGAGSGYQAAIISEMVGTKGTVISTEIVSELVVFATENLKSAGIKNVEVVCWDGSKGYEKQAPYDKIIVTAACPKIPKPLVEQLKEGGILVAPVGSLVFGQKMLKVKKVKGVLQEQNLGRFVFVPLKGEFGF